MNEWGFNGSYRIRQAPIAVVRTAAAAGTKCHTHTLWTDFQFAARVLNDKESKC